MRDDLTDHQPRLLNPEVAERANVAVTMGCDDQCPFIPGKRYIGWEIEDPNGRPVDDVRATRDEIRRRIVRLQAELDATPAGP